LTRFSGSSSPGGVHITEQNTTGDNVQYTDGFLSFPFSFPLSFAAQSGALFAINASITTREYTLDSMDEKIFTKMQAQFNCTAGDNVQVSAIAHDPDAEIVAADYTFGTTQDGTIRSRVQLRGSSLQAKVSFVSGMSSLKSVSVTGILASRSMDSAE
jgi:hypothetical protein